MICIKFDQKIKKPKSLNFGLLRFFQVFKNVKTYVFRSHFPALVYTPVASLFLLPTVVVVVIVVITVFGALLLYCTFKIYSAILLSGHKCLINSMCSSSVIHSNVFVRTGDVSKLSWRVEELTSCNDEKTRWLIKEESQTTEVIQTVKDQQISTSVIQTTLCRPDD